MVLRSANMVVQDKVASRAKGAAFALRNVPIMAISNLSVLAVEGVIFASFVVSPVWVAEEKSVLHVFQLHSRHHGARR